jgi:hypothetical protein
MKNFHWLTFAFIYFLVVSTDTLSADLIFSQYVETNSGTTPKGVEIWNSGASAIDFSITNLQIFQGTNGGNLSALNGTLINSGSLSSGNVLVIGTTDIGTYLSGQGLGAVRFVEFGFSFNGNDALQLRLGGTAVDTFGTPNSDPGTAWTANGVSTANQNIALREGILAGNSVGFTDPSTRFLTVSSTPSTLPAGLSGFGIAPTAVPEPSSIALLSLVGIGGFALRRLRKGRTGS